jgi:hypothetical protein
LRVVQLRDAITIAELDDPQPSARRPAEAELELPPLAGC